MDELSALAVAAGAGDRDALRRFVQATQADVWRLCAHLGDRAGADDLTQEVYLRVLPALAGFRGDSAVRTWLLAIARRTVADDLRARTRRRRLVPPRRPPSPAVDDAVALAAAVHALAVERRAAFVLTQVVGLSYAEAAEVCNCPIGTIRSRVARAREDLVAALGAGEADGFGGAG